MPTVKVYKGNFEQAIRKFRKICDDEDIVKIVRSKQYFEKPCDKRNRRKSAAIARSRRETKSRL